MQARLRLLFLALCWLVWGGCATPGNFSPVDLAGPGWQTRMGQAVWQPGRDRPEIVGDLILSTHASEGGYVQFSKGLPIASGRLNGEGWSIEFPPQNKRYAARGVPPRRIVWLQLLREVEGNQPTRNWTVSRTSGDGIRLEDDSTGERLELFF